MVVVPLPKNPMEESIYALRAIPEPPPATRRSGIMASPLPKEAPKKGPVSVIFNTSPVVAADTAPVAVEWKLTPVAKSPRTTETGTPISAKGKAGDVKNNAPERRTETPERKADSSDRKIESHDRKSDSKDRKGEPKDRKTDSNSRKSPSRQEPTVEATARKSRAARVAIIVTVLVAIIGLPAVGIGWWQSHQAPVKPLKGEDKDIQMKLEKEPHQEVHSWFQQDPNRVLGPWTKAQALDTADQWKKQGAKQVIAFGTHISTVAVIELPDNPLERKGLFDWEESWNQQHDQKVWPDVGQKYLLIQLGI
jgi:hypothetical protein